MSETTTTKSIIVRALRMLWLRSRERAAALKNNDYTCQKCNVRACYRKGEEVKIEVHHKHGVNNWDEIIEAIRKNLLVPVDKLECLCKECHKKETFGH